MELKVEDHCRQELALILGSCGAWKANSAKQLFDKTNSYPLLKFAK
jgi:hypothetical protein